jgi:transcriptional antiterminator RfaH
MPLLELEPSIYPESLLASPCTENKEDRWWVLHTRPRVEKTLSRKFFERGSRFYLPLYRREWRNKGRLFQSHLPLFPGYVFLFGDRADRLQAFETNLVANIIPVEDQAQLLADLNRVHGLLSTGAPVTPEDRLEPGDPVEIVRGPFAGLEGKVIRRGKQLRLVIEVQFLRRAVSAEMESWMIRAPMSLIANRQSA